MYIMNKVVKNSDTIYRRDMKSDKYLQEIKGKLPERLNKLGECFFLLTAIISFRSMT